MDKLLVGGASLQLVKWGTASRAGKGLVYLYRRGRRLHLRSGVQGTWPRLVATVRASANFDGDALRAAVAVEFVLQRECRFGQSFNVVGDDPVLGGWNPDSVVPMEWSEGHIWTCKVDLPARKRYEYKFLLKGTSNQLEWQPGPNRWFDTSNSSLTIVGDWDEQASHLPAAKGVRLGTQEDTATLDTVNSIAESIAEETSTLDAVEELVKPTEEQGVIEEPATAVSDLDPSGTAALPDDPPDAANSVEEPAAALPPEAANSPEEPAAAISDDSVESAAAVLCTVNDGKRAQSTPPSCGEAIHGEKSQRLHNGEEESNVSGEEAPENSVGVNKQEESESDPCLLETQRAM